jgi:hypothetical protein
LLHVLLLHLFKRLLPLLLLSLCLSLNSPLLLLLPSPAVAASPPSAAAVVAAVAAAASGLTPLE